MSSVRRVYVEKKPDFAVQAKELKHEISSYLGIKTVTAVHVYIRYDVENISEEVFRYLLAGQLVHIGKNTTMGFGQYQIEPI